MSGVVAVGIVSVSPSRIRFVLGAMALNPRPKQREATILRRLLALLGLLSEPIGCYAVYPPGDAFYPRSYGGEGRGPGSLSGALDRGAHTTCDGPPAASADVPTADSAHSAPQSKRYMHGETAATALSACTWCKALNVGVYVCGGDVVGGGASGRDVEPRLRVPLAHPLDIP